MPTNGSIPYGNPKPTTNTPFDMGSAAHVSAPLAMQTMNPLTWHQDPNAAAFAHSIVHADARVGPQPSIVKSAFATYGHSSQLAHATGIFANTSRPWAQTQSKAPTTAAVTPAAKAGQSLISRFMPARRST